MELLNAELRPEVVRLARMGTSEQTIRRMDAIGATRDRIDADVATLLAVRALIASLLRRRRRCHRTGQRARRPAEPAAVAPAVTIDL